MKGSWVEIRTGRDHSQITITDKTDGTWEEKNLIYHQSNQSRITRNRKKLNTFPPPSLLMFAEPLSIIFERSWRTGEVPEDWRKASVTLIFKKGKKKDSGNYRLVSLTSIPGKVMAQLILEVINKQVEEKKVISSSQHGFTKGKSCLTNLTAF